MTHYKLLLLLVSFFCITSLYAQKRNFLMYKDSVLGKDTLILNVEFSFGASSASAKQRQYSISIEKNGRIVKTYDAKDIVRLSGRRYNLRSQSDFSQRREAESIVTSHLLERACTDVCFHHR